MIRSTYELNGTNIVLPNVVSFKREYLAKDMYCLSIKFTKSCDDLIIFDSEGLAEEAEQDLVIEINNYYKNIILFSTGIGVEIGHELKKQEVTSDNNKQSEGRADSDRAPDDTPKS